jgi:hypothetical protein
MTNKLDDLTRRILSDGEGYEETEGVPKDGFSDPTGQYPNRDYFFGTSINKSAKGEKVNTLDMGGGDYGVSVSVPEQPPSQYPNNQVQETPSGHIIEIDDTPGGERVMIRHRTGAGVDFRADGTVIISSKHQKIEVTGGDHTTIVEGEGNLVYKGNLNLTVSGDFNVDVGGNYNLKVGGDKQEEIKGRHTKVVNRDQNYTIRGARGEQVIGMATTTVLDDYNVIVKGTMNNYVEQDIEMLAGNNLITTAVSEWVAASSTANITARHVSMIGHKGTIGGPLVDHYGKTYGGFPAGVTNLSTFYGTLVGKAAESLHADYAMFAAQSGFAVGAAQAITAVKDKGKPPSNVLPKPGVMPFVPMPPTAPLPNPAVVELQLATSNYGIRNVAIDPKLKDKISRSDEYQELFNFDPTIHEIRSKLRDPQHIKNTKFTGYLVSNKMLNKDFAKTIPKNIGRVSSKGTVRFGVTPLGNNPAENRSKRFKVQNK